jgi:hypothetical protein
MNAYGTILVHGPIPIWPEGILCLGSKGGGERRGGGGGEKGRGRGEGVGGGAGTT